MQCRACMQSKDRILFNMAISLNNYSENLYYYFNECTQLNASANDNLPENLCKECVSKLQDAYEFRKCARESNEKYNRLLMEKEKTQPIINSNGHIYVLPGLDKNTEDKLTTETDVLNEPQLELYGDENCSIENSQKPKDIGDRSTKSLNTEIIVLNEPQLKLDVKENCARVSNDNYKRLLMKKKKTQPIINSNGQIYVLPGVDENTDDTLITGSDVLNEPQLELYGDENCSIENSQKPNDIANRSTKFLNTKINVLEGPQLELYRIGNSQKAKDTGNDSTKTLNIKINVLSEPQLELRGNKNCSIENLHKPKDLADISEFLNLKGNGKIYEIESDCNTDGEENNINKKELRQFSELNCETCSLVFDRPKDMKIHRNLIHDTETPVQCVFCSNKPLVERSELTKHFQIKHCTRYVKYFLKGNAKIYENESVCNTCSLVFDRPKDMEIHRNLIHDTETPVQCEFCSNKPLVERSELTKHFQIKHCSRYVKYFPLVRPRYTCKYCQANCSNVFDLADHVSKHAFKCKICLKIFNRIYTYNKHVKSVHNGAESNLTPIPCMVEGIAIEKCKLSNEINKPRFKRKLTSNSTSNAASESPKEHGDESQHDTAISIVESDNQVESDNHNGPESNLTPIPCMVEGGDIEIYNPSNKINNRRIKRKLASNSTSNAAGESPKEHGDESQHDTAISTVESDNQEDSEQQESRGILEDNFEESTTDIEILDDYIAYVKESTSAKDRRPKRSKNCQKQKKSEKEERVFLCAFCPYVSKCKNSMEKHEEGKHSSSGYQLCTICGKKLRTNYIKTHVKEVHGDRQYLYSCEICGNSYTNKSKLNTHRLLHKKERKHPCILCDKSYVTKTDLKIHMRSHTGEEPYACHLCDRTFKMKCRLNYHLQKHNNIMHKCKVCGKEYTSTGSLRNHSFVHSGVKPYRCPDCDYAFAKRQDFAGHLLRIHDKVMTDLELSEMFKANTGRYSRVVIFEETDT